MREKKKTRTKAKEVAGAGVVMTPKISLENFPISLEYRVCP